jgi:hypothetical protein
MKKLLVLALVLSMASMANAALTIGPSASSVNVDEAITISLDAGVDVYDQGGFYLGISNTSIGGATLDILAAVINYTGNASSLTVIDDPDTSAALGLVGAFVLINLSDIPPAGNTSPPVTGLLASGFGLTGATAGMVDLVVLSGADGSEFTRTSVEVTPEPITIGLLGLGAMFLRRRK